MPRELMPLHTVSKVATPPRRASGTELGNLNNRVAKVIRAAEAVGITIPGNGPALYARARALRTTPIGPEMNHALLADQVAAGDLTVAEADALIAAATPGDDSTLSAQLHTRRRAGEKVYVASADAVMEAAPAIYDAARAKLDATLTEQLAADFPRPDLEATYKGLHALAATLRWATGWCQAPEDFWRFNRPELVYAWRIDEADRRIKSRDPRPQLWVVSHTHHGDVMGVSGIGNPTFYDAATHPEWEPGIILGPDVIANADRIEQAQREDATTPAP